MRILLLLAAMGVACSNPPEAVDDNPDPDPPNPPAETESIRLATSMDNARAEQFGKSFGLLEARDLFARIKLRHEGGLQFLKFDILNGEGTAQQTRWIAFTTDTSGPATVNHPLLDGQVDLQVVTPRDGFVTVYVHIPVAGSVFTRYRLQGEFTAKASVGIGDEPATISSQFELTR